MADFFDRADLARKLNGFMVAESKSKVRGLLYHMKELLLRLSYNAEDGIVEVSEGKLTYIMLNPALVFKRLIDEADKVVLASGTLEPTAEYDVLKSYLPKD